MKKIVLCLSLLLSSCFTPSEGKLIGIWVINTFPSEISYSVIEYQKSGDKCEISFNVNKNGDTRTLFYWNKWKLESDVIKTTMVETAGSIPIGTEIEDKIEKLTTNELVVNMIKPVGEFETEFHIRDKKAKINQICSIVKNHFRANIKNI